MIDSTPATAGLEGTASTVRRLTCRPLLNDGGPLPVEGGPPVCVAPASSTTVNKLAGGIADTPVTSVAAEALGAGRRLVVAPSSNSELLAHPVLRDSRARSASWGVQLLWPETGNEDLADVEGWWEGVVGRCAAA